MFHAQFLEGKRALVTGSTSGIGLAIARALAGAGARVVLNGFGDAGEIAGLCKELDATHSGADLTDVAQIEAMMAEAGEIDVLVNNAGIGYFAAVEESEEDEVRKMFDVNVFGTGRMIWAVLPGMRQRRAGCIVNLSSVRGLCGFPALGYYNATKFAVEGLSAALRLEVEPLGLQVMVVEPSGFRTDWAGRSANESKQEINDYAATAGATRAAVRASSGQQPGDPVRAARAILDAVASGKPPHHLLLGNDAFEGAMAKLDHLREDFVAVEAVARAADFPKPKASAQA